MKELSVREFGEFCKTIHPSRFLFSSEDQCGGTHFSQVIWFFDFQTMTPNSSLSTICFGDNRRKDQIKFTMVKSVRIPDNTSSIGTTFMIVCRGLRKSSHDQIFTFVAL